MLSRLRSLIIKELLAALKDPKARVVLIVPPLLQALLFSFAITLEANNLTLAVHNLDGGKWGSELVQRLSASRTFTEVFAVESEKQITRALDEQQAIAVLSIPQDFSRAIENETPVSVQLLLDGRKTNTAQIVAGYTLQIVASLQEELAGGQQGNVILIERNWFNPNLDYKWFTVPSLVVILSTLIALLVTAMSVAREREVGTFEQLLVSPLRPAEILLGKAGAALLIAMVEATGIILIGVYGFKIPFQGSLLLLYGSMAIFLLSIIGVGLFISSLSTTQQQGILGAFTFMVPAVVLSGFATPIENMPHWLQVISLGNPLRWFMLIVRGIFLKGMPATDVISNTWPMAVIAVVTLSAAAVLFRKRME
ncbi:MAG TPA: ABC transporter permease [Desulfobacteraceae bacterium]|nr:ABC transporter permease [Desulfobacteraceae bacterium]HPJ66661.1 ABC transporter permease [Desulfobacteraceae bacterium]HPQ27780.1 ABC transporter permease [Desulfobacteraceae bacterium]